MESACRVYRPRDPRKTALWGLLDTLYERVKGSWEERFERSYGFWRGLADGAVARYLDCGVWDNAYFLHHRELLGELMRAAAETVKELLAAAAREEEGFRPGVVSVVQTFGERANFHPHVHALVTRGGWTASGEWVPVPYVDERSAEELFRVFAHPGQGRDLEALVRYMMRSPVSLKRLCFTPGSKEVVYERRKGHDAPELAEDERIDAEEFVARVLVQIPDPRRHLVRYYGAYSNRARGQRRKAEAQLEAHPCSETSQQAVPTPPERAALRRRWANLIRRVYEVDPLVCPRCGAEMRVIGFITEPSVIKRILDHIRKRDTVCRPPPHLQPAVASIA